MLQIHRLPLFDVYTGRGEFSLHTDLYTTDVRISGYTIREQDRIDLSIQSFKRKNISHPRFIRPKYTRQYNPSYFFSHLFSCELDLIGWAADNLKSPMIVVIGDDIDVYSTEKIDFVERYKFITVYDNDTTRKIIDEVDGSFIHDGKLFYPVERELDVRLLV